jgi:hypothetical protein
MRWAACPLTLTLALLVAWWSTGGCTREEAAVDDLSRRLTELGYAELFLELGDETLDSLWHTPGVPARLAALSGDLSAPAEARFLAAETLFRRDSSALTEARKAALAPAYAEALRHAALANPWGLPGTLDGPAGQHVVSLGEPAVAALTPLLTDGRPVLYAGSAEATFGNSYRYRVKDLAAFLISRIRGLSYPVHLSPVDRDTEIARLGASL